MWLDISPYFAHKTGSQAANCSNLTLVLAGSPTVEFQFLAILLIPAQSPHMYVAKSLPYFGQKLGQCGVIKSGWSHKLF